MSTVGLMNGGSLELTIELLEGIHRSFKEPYKTDQNIKLKLNDKDRKIYTLSYAMKKLNEDYAETDKTKYVFPFMIGSIVNPMISIFIRDEIMTQHNFRSYSLHADDMISIKKAVPFNNMD